MEEENTINIPLSEENLEILHSRDEKRYLEFMGWSEKPAVISQEMQYASLYGIEWIDHLFMVVDEKMSYEALNEPSFDSNDSIFQECDTTIKLISPELIAKLEREERKGFGLAPRSTYQFDRMRFKMKDNYSDIGYYESMMKKILSIPMGRNDKDFSDHDHSIFAQLDKENKEFFEKMLDVDDIQKDKVEEK